MNDRPYSALIVDFGGVLTTSIWDSFDAFCRTEGLDEGAVRRLFRDHPPALADLRELEKGEIDEADFERRFAEHLGLPRGDGLIERMFAGLGPDERTLGAVQAARDAGLRTGLLSNSWGTSIYDSRQLARLFDAVVISGEVGLHKPQPEIFLLAAERVGARPERCVFVDDLRENIAGAEAVGMTGLLHRDSNETVARLGELLGIAVA